MTRHRPLIGILIVTYLIWVWAGYRLAAWQTGVLGPIGWELKNLDHINKVVQWSPTVAEYSFSRRHQLILPGRGTALFLLNPPTRFGQAMVTIVATGPVDLTAEYRAGVRPPIGVKATRTFRWAEINRFPGGYRLHISNLTNRPNLIQEIGLTFIR